MYGVVSALLLFSRIGQRVINLKMEKGLSFAGIAPKKHLTLLY
jgi:hypothetical protein